MKKIIYTCVTGNYDKLKDPFFVEVDCEYICFTDHPNLNWKVWKSFALDKKLDNQVLTARYHKTILCNKLDADLVIWQDGKVILQESSERIFHTNVFSEDIFLFEHPDRNCIYDELREVLTRKKCDPEIVKKQCFFYKQNQFPDHQGLYETCLMARKRNNRVDEINELWWHEICKWSCRDQISLPFVLYNYNQEILLKLNKFKYWTDKYFEVICHSTANHRNNLLLL